MKKKVLPSIHISLQDQSGSVAWVWYMYFSWLVDNIEKNAEDIATLDEELDTKVDKTSDAEKLYGTDENGDQTTYDIDSLIPDVNLDNVTIDKNSSDQLQAIGTKNKNTASGATANIYDWVGTLAEYNAQNIATTHPDWLCFITDDVNPDTTYTKAEADALFVRKTGNYNESVTGVKNFTSEIQARYRQLAPSTNTEKTSSVDDTYIRGDQNTSNKLDGMYIIRRQNANGTRVIIYGAGFRTGDDSANKWSELQLGLTQDDKRIAYFAGIDDLSVSNNDNYACTTRHLIRVLAAIYPVGSLYIGTQSSCPMAQFFGTWALVATDRALWGGNGSNGNSTINAGLPNITGNTHWIGAVFNNNNQSYANGVFSPFDANNGAYAGGGGYSNAAARLNFNASRSSSIYGNSTTVQPNAYRVNVWRRTA